jgi:CheY-like chemotaxis protein
MANRRVLLIDDEDDIREVAQLSLEVVGKWDVLTASSGAEGILCAAAEQPDAILLDVMMPDMDGPATFRELRANPRTQHIPVILLTAKMHPSEHLARDVVAVISKPFDPLRLPGDIARHLGWAVCA